MVKPVLKKILAKLGLLVALDQIRMHIQAMRNYRRNVAFIRQNPGFILPDDKILYETFRLDYQKYYSSGKDTAAWLIQQYQTSTDLPLTNILDWGCGPARVVRHLPKIEKSDVCEIWGSGFNSQSIAWCRKNINDVQFSVNNIHPPTTFSENKFAFVYAISVFTHLAASRNQAWIGELHRIIKPAGILLFTTQGQSFIGDLTTSEKAVFEVGQVVTRQNDQEGRRIYSAYHPPASIYTLLSDLFEVIKHIPGLKVRQRADQDIWIVMKK